MKKITFQMPFASQDAALRFARKCEGMAAKVDTISASEFTAWANLGEAIRNTYDLGPVGGDLKSKLGGKR